MLDLISSTVFWDGIGVGLAGAIGIIITVSKRYRNVILIIQVAMLFLKMATKYLKVHPDTASKLHTELVKEVSIFHHPPSADRLKSAEETGAAG